MTLTETERNHTKFLLELARSKAASLVATLTELREMLIKGNILVDRIHILDATIVSVKAICESETEESEEVKR